MNDNRFFNLSVAFLFFKTARAYAVELLKCHVDRKASEVSVELLVHSVALYLSDHTHNIVQP